MLIYAVNADETKAITVGHMLWFERPIEEMSNQEIYDVCRPRRAKKTEGFDLLLDSLGGKDNVRFCVATDVPDTCKKSRGFWESVNG